MVVKLRTTQIGLKRPINVKANLTNVDKADEMMIALLSLNVDMDEAQTADNEQQDDSEAFKAGLDALKKERAFTKQALSFLQDVLGLSDKQLEIVKDHADFAILGSYLSYVCNRIKGVPEKAFQEESTKSVPKDQSANSEEQ
ncbi:phage tail tube assembly chaperone [Limosilactobacillus fermentum]|uniref:phage tail tube assembly chaperone n=1 Tax=Limosilactobacillus fermentum TaxID=1613 RepID=UPI002AC9602C|nr:phage tail tube assembly chaperone [Limosilactobacillus fermentum]